MKVLTYENSTRGGLFVYGQYLARYYGNQTDISQSIMLVPANTSIGGSIITINRLLPDTQYKSRLVSKLYYLWRTLINPLILCWYVIKIKPDLIVINSFDQPTSWLWAPLLKMLKPTYSKVIVYIHDLNRDEFFSLKMLSSITMKGVVWVADILATHEELPLKPYYKNKQKKALVVPHGSFDLSIADSVLKAELSSNKYTYLMFGHLRDEKNYLLALRALSTLNGDYRLIIAGEPSSTSFDIDKLHTTIRELGIEHRVILITKYLTENELSSIFEVSDTILMYYKKGFVAQSGILNIAAQFNKKIIISDLDSALTKTVKNYGVGQVIAPDNKQVLTQALKLNPDQPTPDWSMFLKENSWEKHVQSIFTKINDNSH